MLYQLSYASQNYRKNLFWATKRADTLAPAALAAQNSRLAQGRGWGKPRP